MLCICTLGKVEIAVGAKLLKLLKSGGTAVKWRWSRSGDQIKLPRHAE